MPDVIPGQKLDQYQVEEVIARSGMATIFRARDTQSGQPVVLKVPHIQFEADLVFHQRFQREEEIGLRLDHPGVVGMLKPTEKSRVYLAMELVEGESLRELLRRESPLAISKAVEIATEIADVLVYLHEHGVIHRDLKPENVMLLPNGGVKIMDFGIAVDTSQGRMTWGGLSQTMGTPDYMLEVREKLAHPGSIVLTDRTHRTEPGLPASARLAAGAIGLAALFGAFRALAGWFGR
jgi:serine/threonine protein kinase